MSAKGRTSHAWLILPMLGAGLLVACIAALVHVSRPTRPASAVKRQIQDIALTRGGSAEMDDGGLIGPCWVAAQSLDADGEWLRSFRLSCGEMELAARSARVTVDATSDSFSFELDDVVFLRRPPSDGAGPEHFLLSEDHRTLGPVPYGVDIVSDGGPPRGTAAR